MSDPDFEALRSMVQRIADEAFGPFPVQTIGESLTRIEEGIFTMRQRADGLEAERDMWQARAHSDRAGLDFHDGEVEDLVRERDACRVQLAEARGINRAIAEQANGCHGCADRQQVHRYESVLKDLAVEPCQFACEDTTRCEESDLAEPDWCWPCRAREAYCGDSRGECRGGGRMSGREWTEGEVEAIIVVALNEAWGEWSERIFRGDAAPGIYESFFRGYSRDVAKRILAVMGADRQDSRDVVDSAQPEATEVGAVEDDDDAPHGG